MGNREIEAIRALLRERPRPADLAERRARLDGLGANYAVPADIVAETVSIGGVTAEWTWTADTASSPGVMLFLHGGGYVSGSLRSHRHLVAEAGRQAGLRTLALDYRLAPEHPFPAALEDALAAVRFVVAGGTRAADLVLAGESAGGGLALATALRLRESGDALPRCMWLSSPWVDLTMAGSTMDSKAAADPLLSRAYLEELATAYAPDADRRQPLISPLWADLRGLPPVLVQVGSAETLLSDATRLAAALGEADTEVTLQVWPEMIHAWSLFHPQLAAGRAALAEMGRWVRAHSAAGPG